MATSSSPAHAPRPERLLEHYLRFILREESAPLRDRLQQGLVEHALKASNPRDASSASGLRKRIESLTNLPSYPQELVVHALNELVSQGKVEAVRNQPNPRYRLVDGRRRSINAAMNDVNKQEESFNAGVLARIEDTHGSLDVSERALIEQAWRKLVGAILESFGVHCARGLVEQRQWTDQTDSYANLRSELSRCVAPLPEALRVTTQAIFEQTLRDPTPSEAKQLYAAGQVYYIAELLHLDPELQALQRSRLESTAVYLDTNLILRLILEENRDHSAVLALVGVCRAAGLQLRYSGLTSDELESLLTAADRDFNRSRPYSLDIAAKLAALVENPFLKAFFTSQGEDGLSWPQYLAGLAGWRERLAQLGVEFDGALVNGQDSPRVTHLKGVLVRKAAGSGRKGKRARAVEHDARMLAAVEQLVKRDDAPLHPFGNRFWFITFDRSVAECARRYHDKSVGCVCMLADEWLTYVAPFASPNVSASHAADIFASLLASRLFVSLGTLLTLEDLKPFTVPGVDDLLTNVSEEDACRFIVRIHSEVAARGATSGGDELALKRLTDLVERSVESRLSGGDLVKASELESARAKAGRALARRSRQHEADVKVRDARITALEEELAKARADNRFSLSYWGRRAKEALHDSRARLVRWIRAHPWRAAGVISVLVLAVTVEGIGYLGVLGRVAAVTASVVALLAADTNIIRRNLSGRR